MKNSLNRFIPDLGFLPYDKADSYIDLQRHKKVAEVLTTNQNKMKKSIQEVFDSIPITNGMCLSFHHHLRNGDYLLNMVMEEVQTRGLKEITIAPSGIFPVHEKIVPLIESGAIDSIYTNYINGPVAEVISQGKLKYPVIMDTHGGRPRAIESGELVIDVAFLAVPTADKDGNGNGIDGPSSCGPLGYAIPDMKYAKHTVVVTDNLVDKVEHCEIQAKYIDYVVVVDKIGDPNGIVSGTTKPTRDPIQLKIARNTAQLIEELDFLKDGFSFQTGAGGISLAVSEYIKTKMLDKGVKGSFASGGITAFLVDMLENDLFENLYDVQCFDLEAIKSYRRNKNHIGISSSKYGNPFDQPVVNNLDVVVLGATEVDKDFNVNVTTDSNNLIMGGSGGHSDTSYGAKLSIITTNLIKTRNPIIKNTITTITTPGETIDCIVTERGIAINPRRTDLIEKLKNSNLKIVKIEELIEICEKISGIPKEVAKSDQVVGLVRYRNGSFIDSIFGKK